MKLKKVTLNNIRSYNTQEIVFPEGATLLSGDIGSGKTSVLLGIEFGLFGLQPGQRGTSILKNGQNNGGVKIEFEVDKKEVVIERTLKRAKTVTQDYCAITVDGHKKEISVTELKSDVLDLLNYPKEFSKKQNILYKFTVYTPQEEMKQIMLQDAETRINTLRHVFGIDKYKKIIENASIIASKLREEKRLKEGITITLEQDKLDLVSKEEDLETKQYNLASVQKELFLKKEKRILAQEEKEKVTAKIDEKLKLIQEIEKTRLVISNKRESTEDNKRLILQINSQIKELEELIFDEDKIIELDSKINELKNSKEKLNTNLIEISSKINSLSSKIQDNEALKEKLSNLEICPTCLQDVDTIYRSNVLNKLHSDNFKHKEKIEIFSNEKTEIQDKVEIINKNILDSEKNIQDLKILKIKLQGIKEKQDRIGDIEKKSLLLSKDIELLLDNITRLEVSIEELSKFDKIFEEKQMESDIAAKEERAADIKVAELKKEVDVFSKQVDELKERITKMDSEKKRLDYISSLEDWLSKKFTPLISFIEKNVMIKLNAEFSQVFSQWFQMLVSDNFEIRLGEDFTPIIEYQDYEIDYAYLSGGERTAVALAYRLALNQVLNSLLSKIKTRDLVILDEPTDGFSTEQLDKMRDVLQQLNVGQLIIVSHEQKIEGFVENVIRFKKTNGISEIEN